MVRPLAEPAPGADFDPAATVRIGVLGAASTAWRRMLPALTGTPGVSVAAIASRDRSRAAVFTERFGGEPVEGYAALLERADIDAVYVPLPNSLHHEWTAAALAAGKHVLAEKPLTTCAADTADLVRLAEVNNLVLRENFTFLHHPVHAVVRNLVTAGRIGEPRHFTSSFCFPPLPAADVRYRPELGGGALLDVGVYPIRAAQLLFGNEIEVSRRGAARGSGHRSRRVRQRAAHDRRRARDGRVRLPARLRFPLPAVGLGRPAAAGARVHPTRDPPAGAAHR